jgi:hypothetical protein
MSSQASHLFHCHYPPCSLADIRQKNVSPLVNSERIEKKSISYKGTRGGSELREVIARNVILKCTTGNRLCKMSLRLFSVRHMTVCESSAFDAIKSLWTSIAHQTYGHTDDVIRCGRKCIKFNKARDDSRGNTQQWEWIIQPLKIRGHNKRLLAAPCDFRLLLQTTLMNPNDLMFFKRTNIQVLAARIKTNLFRLVYCFRDGQQHIVQPTWETLKGLRLL